ncbi:hypothetical protein [Serratia sp. PL7]|uniref:hypothetical protein n=1 Tax=Serratia sp. PL7 TaxID=2952201 RepID=UPI0019E03A8E|nr:hypothetical protein [Serratia sp. PL7]MBE0153034.1 hypothetical protein [Serratia fonticola]
MSLTSIFIRPGLFAALYSFTLLFFSNLCSAVVVYTYDGFPRSLTAQGSGDSRVSGVFATYTTDNQSGVSSAVRIAVNGTLPTGTYTPDGYPNIVAGYGSLHAVQQCPAGFGPVPPTGSVYSVPSWDRAIEDYLNGLYRGGLAFAYTGTNGGGNSFLTGQFAYIVPYDLNYVTCRATTTTGGTRMITVDVKVDSVVDGVAPGQTSSICTIDQSNLNVSFESLSPTVSVSKIVPLSVTCGAGVPVNYKLSLTSALSDNDMLSFGNGVYASVSFNGISLPVNGDWIRLNQLLSGTKNLTVTLSGTASSAGVTNANGVLLLEIL